MLLMGKSTMSMAIFNSKLLNYQRVCTKHFYILHILFVHMVILTDANPEILPLVDQ